MGRSLLDVQLTFAVDQLGQHCHGTILTSDDALVHIISGDGSGDGRTIPSGDDLPVHRL